LLKVRGITLLAVAALLLHMLLPFYAYYPSPIGQGRPDSLSQNQPPAAARNDSRPIAAQPVRYPHRYGAYQP
jgi:hypothetical protein